MVGQLHNGSFSLRDPREEECWPYIQRLTEEVEALAPRKLLVLGGLGATWMRQKWEMGQQCFFRKNSMGNIWESEEKNMGYLGNLGRNYGFYGFVPIFGACHGVPLKFHW